MRDAMLAVSGQLNPKQGGPGVMATDELVSAGGVLAELTAATIQTLDKALPPEAQAASKRVAGTPVIPAAPAT